MPSARRPRVRGDRRRRAREGAEPAAGGATSGRAGAGGGAPPQQGWEGWDAYAPFYDWENAQTLGRRDVPFWRRVALESRGPVLELGCGTGRVSLPLARAGVPVVGVDRSAAMLERAVTRLRSVRRRAWARQITGSPTGRLAPSFVRADIRALPFGAAAFATVIAPYGLLQSLLVDEDLAATFGSVARVLPSGGRFGIDLVPDVPNWREYTNRVQLRGRAGRGVHLTLVESVRQDRARRLTTFEQRYIERRPGGGPVEHRFQLTFRTLTVPDIAARLDDAGFRVERAIGDYHGRPWDERADVWILLAKKR